MRPLEPSPKWIERLSHHDIKQRSSTKMNTINLNALTERLFDLGRRQDLYERSVINLIASDNAYPQLLADNPPYHGHMIQEGLRGNRPFAGASIHDEIEALAETVACDVFGAENANLQPHSCSQANQAVYQALLKPGEQVLSLRFNAGGHLTHGLKINFSGRSYRFFFYGTKADGLIDYDEVRDLALLNRPRLIVCGSSSYPRLFDAETLRAIADEVGARLMFDLSHEAGLVAGRVVENPIPLSDVTTMSLDKTLRGPFGGIILTRQELAGAVSRAVHPGTQSSFPIRKLTEATHALIMTKTDWFREYARRVLTNAKAIEQVCINENVKLITDGTDKHYVVARVSETFGMNGTASERCLEDIGILSSRQFIPGDSSNRGDSAGGLRLGSAWLTSRGYEPGEVREIAEIIITALRCEGDGAKVGRLSRRVAELTNIVRPKDVWV